VKAAQAVKYVGAGTVEFLLTPQQVFYFLEMNTRLQVEHPVTEQVTGIDLVLLQFAVAAGEVLPFAQADVQVRGHAIEARIYAEDASTGFLPAPGPLLRCRLPSGPGIRVETAVREGDFVQPFYDPLIAKVIATGRSREEALARMDAALADTIILGTPTNVDFVRTLIGHRRFRAGDIDTGFVERERDLLLRSTLDDETLQLALIAAALDDAAVPPKGNGIVGDAPLPVDPWDQTDAFRVSRGNDG
jgi:acetyl/propionyl-CoA carboxylase alpha subunit